jgi:RNA polymerase sigma-70 factor (ECF subfamily)
MIAAEARSEYTPVYLSSAVPSLVPSEMRPIRVDDSRLIRQAQEGDTLAFEQLVRQYDRAVLRLATHMTGSPEDGQDIYQEAFLRAYINLGSFRFECSFFTWLYRIVANLCLDHLRKKSSRGRGLTTTLSSDGEERNPVDRIADQSSGASPERSVFGRELREHIVRAMTRLSPRERVVFELKHYHGMRLRTVADMLNTTEGTIKNTLFRATHKLRTELAAVR